MKQLAQGFYWQDLSVGERMKTWGRTITEVDIVGYCNTVGLNEPLFTDAEYRKQHSSLPGFAAPGALVFSIAEGLAIAGTGHGTGLAFLNTDIDVKKPVVAGDTIHVVIEVTEVRATSKGRGLVRTRNEIVNQRGETVIVYNPLRLMAGRPEAG